LENQERSVVKRKIIERKAIANKSKEEKDMMDDTEKEKEEVMEDIKLPYRQVLQPQKPRKIGVLDDSFLQQLMGGKDEQRTRTTELSGDKERHEEKSQLTEKVEDTTKSSKKRKRDSQKDE